MSGITIKTSATFNNDIELKASSTTTGENDKKKAEITYIDGVSRTSAINYTYSSDNTRLIMSVNNQNEKPGAIQLLNILPDSGTVQYALAPIRSDYNRINNRMCNYKLGLPYNEKDDSNNYRYSYRWDRVFTIHPENVQSDTLLKTNKLTLGGSDISYENIRQLYENVDVYRADVRPHENDTNTETEFTIIAQELETAISDTSNTNLDFLIEESSDEQIFDDSLGTNGEDRNVKTLCPNNINYMNMYMIKTLLDDPIINGSFTLRDNSTDKTQLLNINSDGAFEFGADNTGYGTTGQILQSNGSSSPPTWVTPSSSSSLEDLTDTTITSPSNNDILVYNSANSKWENSNNLTLSGTINDVYIKNNSSTDQYGVSPLLFSMTNHNFTSMTTANNNTFMGFDSGLSLTTGHTNTGYGVWSLYSITEGQRNTAIGNYSLIDVTTGSDNIAIGAHSMKSVTTGSKNIAIGYLALQSNGRPTMTNNLAIGYRAGRTSKGDNNIYIGYEANSSSDGSGSAAEYSNEIVIGASTTGNGSNTVTIGNSSITDNYFNGKMVINYNTTNGIGLDVGNNSDTSAIAGKAYMGYVGYSDYAGFGHIDRRSAGNYALLQDSSGRTILNGSSGQQINFRINNTNEAYYNGNTFRVRNKVEMIYRGQTSSDFLFEDGLVIFGTNSSYVSDPYRNNLFATTNTTTKCMFRAGTVRRSNGSEGQIACSSALTFWAGSVITTFAGGDVWFYPPSGSNVRTNRSFIGSSDDRLKFNEIPVSNALNIINQLNVVKYDKVGNLDETPDSSNTMIEIGLIAQEVELIPELNCAVTKPNNDKDVYGLNYDMIHSYHIKATQELDTIVQNQQSTINELNTKISNLEAENISLKEDNTLLKEENTLIKSKLNEILTEMGKETI